MITGICGHLGQKLARRLHRSHGVIGIDQRPFQRKPKDIQHIQADIRRKQAETIFR
ncbi:MAG: NAD-dependent epimerase, partial [Deltaproteobacteria bacterium]|nr:NAD-dependent epimerase [Deltaproteobacteria bacterium]